MFLRKGSSSCTKALKHFEKQAIAPEESKTFTFKIDAQHLSYPDKKGKPILEPGDFTLSVGGLSAGFVLE